MLHIESQDMKPRYIHARTQKKRIYAYVKAMESCSGITILFCMKEHHIAEFTLKGGENVTREAQRNVRENLQGEVCSVSI